MSTLPSHFAHSLRTSTHHTRSPNVYAATPTYCLRARLVSEHREVLREPVAVARLQAPRHITHQLVEARLHLGPLRRRHGIAAQVEVESET